MRIRIKLAVALVAVLVMLGASAGVASAKQRHTTEEVTKIMQVCQQQGGKLFAGNNWGGLLGRWVDCVRPDGSVVSCGQLSDSSWACAVWFPGSELCEGLGPDWRPCNYSSGGIPAPDGPVAPEQPGALEPELAPASTVPSPSLVGTTQ